MPPLNVSDYEQLSAETLDPGSWAFFARGAGDEHTLRANRAAFDRFVLRPRMLTDISKLSTATSVLGHELSMPLVVAPMARMKMAHPDGEEGLGRAAAAAGVAMCLSFASTSTLPAVRDTGVRRWQHLVNLCDIGLQAEFIAHAEAEGFSGLVLTVDAPVPGRREHALRTPVAVPPDMRAAAFGRDLSTEQLMNLFRQDCSWRDLERIVEQASVPVLVKGILTGEDAQLAVEHRAAAVIVSNHGGRQLDRVPATLDVLEEVVQAVGGRAEALALGARAVLLGRAVLWGLVVGGEQGAAHVLELLRAEIKLTLQLLGVASPAALTGAHVARRLS